MNDLFSSLFKSYTDLKQELSQDNRQTKTQLKSLYQSGESDILLHKAIEKQGKGEILETTSEIQERHDAIKKIENNSVEVHEVFSDIDALNDIESHFARANSFVRRGTRELEEARQLDDSLRQWTCVAIIAAVLLILVILLPMLPSPVAERR